MSFTIPLTGSTIVATVAVVTTCFASADCTDSATPTCSGDICVTMSCGGGSFTPDGAYDSLWDNVKPMIAWVGLLIHEGWSGWHRGACIVSALRMRWILSMCDGPCQLSQQVGSAEGGCQHVHSKCPSLSSLIKCSICTYQWHMTMAQLRALCKQVTIYTFMIPSCPWPSWDK